MTPQALTGSSLTNLLRQLYKHGVDKKYWIKLPALLCWSALLAPMYLLEKLVVFTIVKNSIHPEPIFIIGHWRSGTTYLHYLMAKDRQFGYCSNVDAFVPGGMLLGQRISRKIIGWRLPKTRPMDGVKLHADAPQEDEFPMMLLSPYSCYHSFVFPRSSKKELMHHIVFDDLIIIKKWSEIYFQFLRKLSYRNRGKRLLLKNPVNTTRIKYLLAMFPQAKFIYIHRHPDEVKASSLRMFKSMTQINTLQDFDLKALKKDIALFHAAIIEEYEIQRKLINPCNLVEVRYEDLVNKPLPTVRKIYEDLRIEGCENALPAFEDFVAEQRQYKPHSYGSGEDATPLVKSRSYGISIS